MLHLWFCCPMVVGRVRSVFHLLCHHLLFVLKGTLRYMLIESPYKSRHHPNFIHFCLIRLFPTISHHQSFPSNEKLWVFKTCQTFNFGQIPCTLETNIAPAHSCLDKIFLRWNMSRGYVEIRFVHLFFFSPDFSSHPSCCRSLCGTTVARCCGSLRQPRFFGHLRGGEPLQPCQMAMSSWKWFVVRCNCKCQLHIQFYNCTIFPWSTPYSPFVLILDFKTL